MKNMNRIAVLGMIMLLATSAAACNTEESQVAEAVSQEATLSVAEGETPSFEEGEMPSFGEGEMPSFGEGEMPSFGEGQMPGGQGGGRRGQGGFGGGPQGGQMPGGESGQMPGGNFGGQGGQRPGGMGGGMMGNQSIVESAESPTEIVTSGLTSTAASLTVNESAAETIVMSESNSEVKIDTAGTYLVTGSCSDGNITVKKSTTGVVLILKDLDLTSTTGATVSCNKGSQVKIVIEGDVSLTDAEDPADEESTDAEVADAFDGAALKVKDGADVYLTGTGTLTIDGSSCKNGIKAGDEEGTCLVIDGDLTIDITAANDGINAGYDLTILSGNITVAAGDDAIHADRILTVGSGDGSGPEITITGCEEALEGTIVNLFGGSGTVKSSDDGVNAANKDGTYSSELTFAINITGGTWEITSGGDGLDSNGDINITGGQTAVTSTAMGGGEGGVDWVGSLYVADGTLTNNSGYAYDAMPRS